MDFLVSVQPVAMASQSAKRPGLAGFQIWATMEMCQFPDRWRIYLAETKPASPVYARPGTGKIEA